MNIKVFTVKNPGFHLILLLEFKITSAFTLTKKGLIKV